MPVFSVFAVIPAFIVMPVFAVALASVSSDDNAGSVLQ